MNILYIIKKKYEQLITRIKLIKKRSIYCIVGGIVFMALSMLINQDSIYIRPNEILRSSYGTQKTPYSIKIDAENLAKNMEFVVSVSPKKYTKEEADIKFDEKFEEIKIDILNNNNSYENINTKLSFKSDVGDGIRASYAFEPKRIAEFYDKYDNRRKKRATKSELSTIISTISTATFSNASEFKYYVDYQNVIDGSGNVNNENFKYNEFCTGYIVIQLSTDIKEKEGSYKSFKYMIPIRVTGKNMTILESFVVSMKKELINSDNETINEDTIKLPKVVNDHRIVYKENKNLSFLLMPLFGVLVAILLEAKDKEDEKEKEKRKIRLLEIDFSQIISKVLLYVSSGMTIRNSFIRLAENYQSTIKDKNLEPHKAYEELIVVKNKLCSGYSEINAYEDMAKNINLRIYTRFINIIIQSIKNGNKDLKSILNMEVQDALYERKQHAKKLGEEAATKLVLPLMMMLSVIMIVIMVPAFMGM